MNYNRTIDSQHPGCVLIMVDQAASMEEPSFSNLLRTPLRGELTSRAHVAAAAADDVIYELGSQCQSGLRTRDWFMVGVVGYGNGGVRPICGGMISSLMQQPRQWKQIRRAYPDGAGNLIYLEERQPVWVEPVASGKNLMAEAFAQIRGMISSRWLPLHADSFPPIVINITDGGAEDQTAARAEASRLMELKTSNGNVLLFNCCIARQLTPAVVFPSSAEELPSEEARFLFQISSELPPMLRYQASLSGLHPQPGARGFLVEYSPTVLCGLVSLASSPSWIPESR